MPVPHAREAVLRCILASGVVAVVRLPAAAHVLRVVEAIREGGVVAIEITLTTPGALQAIGEVATAMPDVEIGAGSVLNAKDVRRALDAGARYVVSPVFKKEIVLAAHARDAAAMPGAFSPTEILEATEAGADIVKVFPSGVVGMSYFKATLAPMPHLKLMPTGGVSPENAGDWIRAGAVAVGVGSSLLDKQAIAEGNFGKLTENARVLRQRVAEAKEEQ